METLKLHIAKPLLNTWESLPLEYREKVANKTLNAFLDGKLYPTGVEQMELAIDLAEAGVDPETISRITRLD